MRRPTLQLSAVATGIAVAGIALAAPGQASITGPCSASIGGRNVALLSTRPGSTPVTVRSGAVVAVTMSARRPMTHLQIFVALGTTRLKVQDKAISSSSWTEEVHVNAYAAYGTGVYKVSGIGTGPGGLRCVGTALVRVAPR